jgi:hypothetical protein
VVGGREISHSVSTIVVESLGLERLFFALECFEFLCDVGVDEVGDVLAVHDLWDDVVLPLVVREDVILCTTADWSAGESTEDTLKRTFEVDVVYPRTAVLQLDVPLEPSPLRVVFVVLFA